MSEAANPDPVKVETVHHHMKKGSIWEVYFPQSAGAERESIYVASFPPIIYFWPAMITFFLCGVLQKASSIDPGTIGWWAISMFAFNVLVIVKDFDQKNFIILLAFIACLLLGAWIVNLKGFTFLKTIAGWIAGVSPTISTQAYFLFSFVFFFFFCWGVIRPLFDHWKLEHNEFVHYIQPIGRDMSIPRAGSTVSYDVPDVMEFLLTLGGGTLVIKREGQTVATIPDVPFLGIRMKAIEKMLSETRVTTIHPVS